MQCSDTRQCFARSNGSCKILRETYEGTGRKCPFAKAEKEITGGVCYPYDDAAAVTYHKKAGA